MESIDRHAKLHIKYERRNAVFVDVLAAGNTHPPHAASMMAGNNSMSDLV
ncbi:MAG TPA: hypothetical protein VGU67_04565 [Edaphobacter sp.]|nr:hypothetical protein [Edaphobacter sp.]